MGAPTPQPHLNLEDVLHIAGPEGPLVRHLKGFEPRQQQLGMMRDVVNAYNEKSVALVEAGTGTGKSMAYLIPAILCALKHNTKKEQKTDN